ncbi:MAG: bifunctional phosphoribosylaminoimidazolecarboxamide formyltransferase/IMP cyclohydrolase, partial [Spirochaetota bacterium]
MNGLKVKNAVISVSDKTGLEELAKSLYSLGVKIYSTGGTARAIENMGIPVTKISDYTGFPEILDGRVKSLHPKIHGGLLAKRDNQSHMQQLQENEIEPFDLVVINLYPFQEVIKKPDAGIPEAVENIDIGGPSMLRSAAKNYQFVCVVPDPRYYQKVIQELENQGGIPIQTRKVLARAVFEKTAYYDSLISSYFHNVVLGEAQSKFPDTISLYFKKRQELRYGENPHQLAAFYTSQEVDVTGVGSAEKLHGRELSFNNILDIESAFEIVKEFEAPACSVIKHTNPCGAACAEELEQAFSDAWECDPVSAFGSIIAFNREVDERTAGRVSQAGFVECIIAPGYQNEALEVLRRKKNVRLLETGPVGKNEKYDHDIKRVIGGLLVQQRDLKDVQGEELKLVTEKDVTEEEKASLLFAWKIVNHVKSNAIVLAQRTRTVGVGAGQMSRVDAAFMAVHKA